MTNHSTETKTTPIKYAQIKWNPYFAYAGLLSGKVSFYQSGQQKKNNKPKQPFKRLVNNFAYLVITSANQVYSRPD